MRAAGEGRPVGAGGSLHTGFQSSMATASYRVEGRRKHCYFTKLQKRIPHSFAFLTGLLVSAETKYLECVIKMLYSIKMLVISLQLFSQVFKRRRRTKFRYEAEAVRKHSEV